MVVSASGAESGFSGESIVGGELGSSMTFVGRAGGEGGGSIECGVGDPEGGSGSPPICRMPSCISIGAAKTRVADRTTKARSAGTS